jgi:hypothetical protein
MRSKNKSSPYAHTLKPEIEKYVNQTEWEENTLVDTEQQESPSSLFHRLPLHMYQRKKCQEMMPLLQSLRYQQKIFRYTTKEPKPLMLLTCLVRKSLTLPK